MEIPRPLSARNKEDFAYPTIKDRVPVILTKVIDHVYRLKTDITEKHGESGLEDLKFICGGLSELKNRIQTDKPLQPLSDGWADIAVWNKYLEETRDAEAQDPSWFKSTWLYTECYFHRKLMDIVHQSNVMKDFDPFRCQKHQSFNSSLSAICTLGEYLAHVCDSLSPTNTQDTKEYLQQFIQISLWGNKCDLSISGGAENAQTTDPISQLNHLRPSILCDQGDKVWHHIASGNQQTTNCCRRVDIVLDNAGFELVGDLCLAEFLLSAGLAREVHFHAKDMPWFVSDVTREDFNWSLEQLSVSESPQLQKLGEKWRDRIDDGTWKFHAHPFWTLPHDFNRMSSMYPNLYRDLAQSSFIFFKGDLNYRKLTGDLKWQPTTSFDTALRGFHPAPLCALRTLKCDLAVGLGPGVAEKTAEQDDSWMITGSWAVIQVSSGL